MLGTVALLRGQRIAPRHLMVFALLSQTLIPWGAMSSGTLLASAYARMTGTELALYAMVPHRRADGAGMAAALLAHRQPGRLRSA